MTHSNGAVSEFLPPHLREALVLAAARGDIERIDQLTDLAALTYPKLVLPRDTSVRAQFTAEGRLAAWARSLMA